MIKVISLLTLLLMTPTIPMQEREPGDILVLQQLSDEGRRVTGFLLHDTLKKLPGPEGIDLDDDIAAVFLVVEVKQVYQVEEVTTYKTKRK